MSSENTDNQYYNLEKKIKTLLAEKGMSIDELADKSSVSRTTIYKIFKSLDFNLSNLEKIREVLDVPMFEFFIQENSLTESTHSLIRLLETGRTSTIMLHFVKEYLKEENLKKVYEQQQMISSKDEQINALIDDMRMKNKLLEDYMEQNRLLRNKNIL